MTDPRPSPNVEHAAASPEAPSTAKQVMYWLTLVSLVAAVAVMGLWWVLAAVPVTASTTFIFLFATIGLWVTIDRLLILAIKRLVRSSLARSADRM